MSDNPNLLAVQRNLAAGRAKRDQLVAELAAHSAQLAALDRDIAARTAVGDSAGARAASAQRSQLADQRSAAAAGLGAQDENLRTIIGGLLIDPCDADPTVPLLLLPVRLETRFTEDRRNLRVRIFPDDIHIDQLDRGLADAEREAAILYWNAVWRASDDEADTAWRALVATVGRQRATWCAVAVEPINLATRLNDGAPAFPATEPRTGRAAIARLLPDRFTAVATQGQQRSALTGKPITPELVVGLFADDGSAMTKLNGMTVVAGGEWLADFNKAVDAGMALTVPLRDPGQAVDRLLVFGVRASGATTAAGELADLLTAHRCTRGLAFVPQGTPSNNTESDRADWAFRADPDAPARTPPGQPADANAQVLAAALGVPAATLATLDHAEMREQGLARAMNIALWGSTWETFLEKVSQVDPAGAALSDAAREQVRQFARDFVRGRGPLPALRVGDQPYGILPVSVMAQWDTARNVTIGRLHRLLARLRQKFLIYFRAVPHLGAGPIDTVIADILGSAPVSVALRVRSVLSPELLDTAARATGLATTDAALEAMIEQIVLEELIVDPTRMKSVGSLETKSRPLPLPLVDDARDADVIAAIITGDSPSISSVLQALVMLSWSRAAAAVVKACAQGRLPDLLRLANDTITPAVRDRVSALAATADRVDAPSFFATASVVTAGARTLAMPDVAAVQPVPALARSFGELALASTTVQGRSQLGTLAVIDWLNASGRLAELTQALGELVAAARGGVAPGQLRIAVAETLDLASHRLDAWVTGLVEMRRQALRTAHPAGITVGAYGWVEDIRLAASAPADGGYIAAPTQAHAITAGILRSAYLSHNAASDGSGAFAIDLSGARVRVGLELLEGIRAGQSLSALLGYRLERRIHEAGLDRLVLTLRAIAPLTQGRVTDRGLDVTAAPAGAVEMLAAGNVTDGVLLVEKFQGKLAGWTAQAIRDRLTAAPVNNPYLTGPWPGLSAAEWDLVSAAIAATAADMDAVGDLLMAETVHQLAQGNMPRASAAVDAAGSGDTPAAEPDVVSTRQTRVPFTHRLLIVTNAGGDGGGWNMSAPRAAAAPLLESWAASRLGPPGRIVVAADPPVTLDQADLCALDLVYGTVDPAGLQRRLLAALPGLPAGAALLDGPPPGLAAGQLALGDVLRLAGSLRRLLVAARPAAPADLGIPNQPGGRTIDPAELAAVQQRLQAAFALLTARQHALIATQGDDPALRQTVDALAGFGVALPAIADERLAIVVPVVLGEVARRLADADAALAGTPTAASLMAAGQAVFGDGFWVAPAMAAPAAGDLWSAAFAPGSITAAPGAVRRYLADRSAVADGARLLSEVQMLAEATGIPARLRAVQMAGIGRDPPTAWIGGKLDPAQPTSSAPVVSAVVDAPDGYDPAAATFALLVDHWTEGMALRERRPADAVHPIGTRAAGGLAFNAAAPGARAPQALLLGISPDGARWTSDRVENLLIETLELAKLRLVSLEYTDGLARVLPALYAQSVSLQGEKALDFRFVAEKVFNAAAVPAFVREPGP